MVKPEKAKLTPKETARAKCTECLGLVQFNRNEIQDCKGDTCYSGPCPLFPYRLGRRTPVKVFRAFCLQCMGGSVNLVRECDTLTCPVHPYRMGRNPARAGMGNHKATFRMGAESAFSKRETTITPTFEETATGRG